MLARSPKDHVNSRSQGLHLLPRRRNPFRSKTDAVMHWAHAIAQRPRGSPSLIPRRLARSGLSPDPLGTVGFGFVVASALVLLSALVVPLMRPRLVSTLLVVQGAVILALALGFAFECAAWAIGSVEKHSFRYVTLASEG